MKGKDTEGIRNKEGNEKEARGQKAGGKYGRRARRIKRTKCRTDTAEKSRYKDRATH
jgi:hypothetical protein